VNGYYREGFEGRDATGWFDRPWSVLRASRQLRSAVHLELGREQMRLPGTRLHMIAPVPYTEARGMRFYENLLDRARWPAFMRLGYDAAWEALRELDAAARRTGASAAPRRRSAGRRAARSGASDRRGNAAPPT
jgi:hypothetical protein